MSRQPLVQSQLPYQVQPQSHQPLPQPPKPLQIQIQIPPLPPNFLFPSAPPSSKKMETPVPVPKRTPVPVPKLFSFARKFNLNFNPKSISSNKKSTTSQNDIKPTKSISGIKPPQFMHPQTPGTPEIVPRDLHPKAARFVKEESPDSQEIEWLPNTYSHSTPPVLPSARSMRSARSKEKEVEKERGIKVVVEEVEAKEEEADEMVIDKEDVEEMDIDQEDVAFDRDYIASHPNGIQIPLANTQTQVLEIRLQPRTEQSLFTISGGVNDLNVCTVRAGKVRVQLNGLEFSVKRGGVWRVRGSEQCWVRHGRRSEKESVVFVVRVGR